MSYKTDLQSNNADLQAILAKVNALPEKGSSEVVEPVVEELTITENGTYAAPDGVDGYSPVTVNVPIPDGYVKPNGTLNITENGEYDVTEKAEVAVLVKAPTPKMQSKTVAPNSNGQTVTPDSGYDGLSSVVVNGDANLVADNIKSGVSIFGVEGSYDGGSGGVETCTVTINNEFIEEGWGAGNFIPLCCVLDTYDGEKKSELFSFVSTVVPGSETVTISNVICGSTLFVCKDSFMGNAMPYIQVIIEGHASVLYERADSIFTINILGDCTITLTKA